MIQSEESIPRLSVLNRKLDADFRAELPLIDGFKLLLFSRVNSGNS